MIYLQHLWQLFLFIIVLVGPIPFCLSLTILNQSENPRSSLPHFLLVLLTGWSISQVCLGLILGSFSALKLDSLIPSETVIFLLGLSAIVYTQKSSFLSLQIIPAFKQPFNRLELLIVSALTFVGAIVLEILLVKPIANYDSLWFHLPVIARWYQTGYFTLLDPAGNWIFGHDQARFYPYNWHILSTLFVIPFREDFLVALPMLLAWVILGLSIYLTCIQLGSTRFYSLVASSLVLTVPMVINQINTIHIDLPLTTFFIASLYFALSYHRSRALSELALYLASLGMLLGIKVAGVAYIVLAIAFLILLEIKSAILDKKSGIRSTIEVKKMLHPILWLGIACFLLLGGFWYVRNLLHINYPTISEIPVKPPIQPAPVPTVPSPKPAVSNPLWQSTLLAQFNPLNFSHWQTLGGQTIFRLQLPFIAMILQLLALPMAGIQGFKKAINENTVCLVLLFLGTGFLYAITPYSSGTSGEAVGYLSPLLGFNLRYGFPFLCILGVVTSAIATHLKTPPVIVTIIVLISSILGVVSSEIFDTIRNSSFTGNSIVWGSFLIDRFQTSPVEAATTVWKLLGSNFLEISIYFFFYWTMVLLLSWLLFKQNPQAAFKETLVRNLQTTIRTAIIIGCIGLSIGATWVARETRDINRGIIYRDIYKAIEQNTTPNQKLGFFLSRRSYLFYGKNLDRLVLNLPLPSDNFAEWFRNLQKQEVKILALGPLSGFRPVDLPDLTFLPDLTHKKDETIQPIFGKDFKQEPVLYKLNYRQR